MHTRYILLILVVALTAGIVVYWKSTKVEQTLESPTEEFSQEDQPPTKPSLEAAENTDSSFEETSYPAEDEAPRESTADLNDADLKNLRGEVYKRFDEILTEFEQRLNRISATQALLEITDLRLRLKRHRDSFSMQSDLDEGSMRRIDETLELLPDAADFDKSECRQYKLEILSQFDPKAPNEIPTHPSVRRVFNFLEIICQK